MDERAAVRVQERAPENAREPGHAGRDHEHAGAGARAPQRGDGAAAEERESRRQIAPPLWHRRAAAPFDPDRRGDRGGGDQRQCPGAQTRSAERHSPDRSAFAMKPRTECAFRSRLTECLRRPARGQHHQRGSSPAVMRSATANPSIPGAGCRAGRPGAVGGAPPRAPTPRLRPRPTPGSRRVRAAPARLPGSPRGRRRSAGSRPRDHRRTRAKARIGAVPSAPRAGCPRAGTSGPCPLPTGARGPSWALMRSSSSVSRALSPRGGHERVVGCRA